MIVFDDEAICWKKNGDQKGRVNEVIEVGGNRGREQTSERVKLMVRNGCHGKQYLSIGMTQRYLMFMVN